MASTPKQQLEAIQKEVLDAMQSAISKRASPIVGKLTVDLIKRKVARGISPIRRVKKFVKYKETYKEQIRGQADYFTLKQGKRAGKVVRVDLKDRTKKAIKRRRGGKKTKVKASTLNRFLLARRSKKFGSKTVSPVNLKLSGDFLNALRSQRNIADGSTRVGFFDDDAVRLEKIHRLGKHGPKQKDRTKRPIIPLKSEQFSVDIEKKIIRVYEKEVKKVLKSI